MAYSILRVVQYLPTRVHVYVHVYKCVHVYTRVQYTTVYGPYCNIVNIENNGIAIYNTGTCIAIIAGYLLLWHTYMYVATCCIAIASYVL